MRACLAYLMIAAAPAFARPATAQVPDRRLAFGVQADLSGPATATVAWERGYGVAAGGRVRVGYTVRLTGARLGDGERWTSAAADLIGTAAEDTVVVGSTYGALNVGVLAEYALTARLRAGFSLDLAGLSVGPRVTGRSVGAGSPFDGPVEGRPSPANLFLGGRRDRGSLNSEFALTWAVSPGVALRGGYSHYVAEFTTRTALANGNDRFRRSLDRPFVGVVLGL